MNSENGQNLDDHESNNVGAVLESNGSEYQQQQQLYDLATKPMMTSMLKSPPVLMASKNIVVSSSLTSSSNSNSIISNPSFLPVLPPFPTAEELQLCQNFHNNLVSFPGLIKLTIIAITTEWVKSYL